MSPRVDDANLRMQQTQAREAERDAQRKIQGLKKSVEQTRVETDNEINQIRDQFEKQYTSVEEKQAEELEKERLKGYENLLQAKRTQEAEIARMRRMAEKELSDLKGNYDYTITETERSGKQELQRQNRSLTNQMQEQSRSALTELDLERKTHDARINELREHQETKTGEMQKQNEAELVRTRENYAEANAQAQARYENTFKQNLDTQSQSITRLNSAAAAALNNLRADTTQKLDAYGSRTADPFYRMLDPQARLVEKEDFYQLTAKIPEHERQNVNVSVRGNEVVISGTRQNADSLQVNPGQVRKTHAYQSFSESFPISWPVENKSVTRYFDGDTLVVTIPKKSVPGRKPYRAENAPLAPGRGAEKMPAAKPDFPPNLPVTAEQLLKKKDPETT